MSVQIHKLEAAEYSILETVEDGFVPDPLRSVALIATHEDKVVGRMLLVAPWHIEGTWIRDGYRGGTVLVRMIKDMESQAKRMGLKKLFSYADREDVAGYLKRLGYTKSDLTVYEKEI
jgi:N-acetylglutamate synthase-like GNAT family acetyltransferase